MTQLSQSELQELATKSNSPCISIYMSAEKAGSETRKNPIRFKNLFSEAEKKIDELWTDSELKNSLKTASSYINNHDFWQHQEDGLVFFIDPEEVKYYKIAYSFEEVVIVSDRFYLKPLLQAISNDAKFYLLALSQNEVQFFLGDRYKIQELNLPDPVPASLAEALKYDNPEKQTQYHSGDTGKSPIYHGQGVGTTDNKDEIKRFFQQIDSGLQSTLNNQNTPLIWAGVEYLFPIYQETNSYSNLVPKVIPGNPENVSAENLHQQAWEIIEAQLATEKQKAIDEYDRLANTSEATDKLAEIVLAAVNGQIDTLFLVANVQKWGSFDLHNNQVEIHSEITPESSELYNLVAVNTYLQGGKIYLMEQEQIPEDKSMMAILRYPLYVEAEKLTV